MKKNFFLLSFFIAQNLFAADEESLKATESYEYAFFKMLATLGILIIFLVLSFWALRKLAQGRLRQINQGSSIKILQRRALSNKSTLYLLEFEGKQILISESQFEIRTIDTHRPSGSKE
jgi:flagellar biogenesis protein FliO